ncbi:capsid protein [Olive latent virus 1]|uniref:Capsid protein n=1 Tax=Olive latent virus 1 TaxID=47669 RepID=Q83942_9TOMB|nr:capsid protein [Olive latent virus 1]CAA59981.1 capsid protein [Olive latent virus 1]
MVNFYWDSRIQRWFYESGPQRVRTYIKRISPHQMASLPARKTKRSPPNRGNLQVLPVIAPVAGGVISTEGHVPRITTTNEQTVVRNTEIISAINSAALGAIFGNYVTVIPSNLSWLAGLSDLYSKYRWRKLRFIYLPVCPTSTQGNVSMSLSFDRIDTQPTSITQMQQGYRAITFPPYAGYDGAMALASFGNIPGMVVVDVDCARMDKLWYPNVTLATFLAMAPTSRTDTCGVTLFTASDQGPAAATNFGQVFCQYEIEFIEPVNPTVNL